MPLQPFNLQETEAYMRLRGVQLNAFENLCLRQISAIKKALGIAAVQTETSSWRHEPVNSQDRGRPISSSTAGTASLISAR
jgi:hypothetical protein